MPHNICYYVIPAFLLLASAAIIVWTGIVVTDEHSTSVFTDSPNKIPSINVGVGLIAIILFLANLFRVFQCTHSRGCCDTGLGWGTFITMLCFATGLFVQVGRLDKKEQDYYETQLNDYYKLTIGQGIFFCVYFLLVVTQFICIICKCCKGCGHNDINHRTDTPKPVFM
jgi:hypothetical protein